MIVNIGFRACRSQSMALQSLIECITTSFDAHKHAVGVFIDIEKACGLRGIVSKWIYIYLENRSQYVQFNGMKFGLQNVTCGVP